MCRPILAFLVSISSFLPAPCWAQGFVGHLEPPVLERGKTTRITLVGTGLGKPLDLWTSVARGAIKATPTGTASDTRASFDVQVAATAPVGIVGARLATVDGLGNAFLILVDDLPVKPGVTSNDAVNVALPASIWGRMREAKVDRYVIDVQAGQRVGFEVVGNRLGKDIDPLLTIRDARGKAIVERDNDAGLYFDCRFEHTFADAGTYTVEVRDARFHGNEHGMYVLRMGKFPAARVAVPSVVPSGKTTSVHLPELKAEVELRVPASASGPYFAELKRRGDEGSTWLPLEAIDPEKPVTVLAPGGTTPEKATPALVPGNLCGSLRTPGERHYFRVELAKGQKIQVRAEARALNSPADLEISLMDTKGKEVRRVSENLQKEETAYEFTAGVPGAHWISVRDVYRDGGPEFAYRLEVREVGPSIQASAEVEGLTVPRESYQPIPIAVTRNDYTGPVTLKLLGAPPGMSLSPTLLEEGVNTLVCKLSATKDAPLGLHTIQIVAVPEKAEVAGGLVLTRPLIDRQIVNVDLIPHALREDQRRLPPALADRFAVQVTPPAPFTIELPANLVTLARYQHVEFPIALVRSPGFTGTLSYRAKGGQIAPKEEGRTRVYAEFAEGKGSIHSRILTNLNKHRVEVTAVAADRDRRITLTRTFELEIRSAFVVTIEPAKIALLPGAAIKARINVDRMKTFDDDVTVTFSPNAGLTYPDRIVIPRGQTGVEIEIQASADRAPGKVNINLTSSGTVGGYEEEVRGRIEIDITKPAPPPKK